MPTYLMTWNPLMPHRIDIGEIAARVERGDDVHGRWSCGTNYRRIGPGDRVFFMRVREYPKGIFGAGYVTSEPYQIPHWLETRAAKGEKSWMVKLDYETLVNPERVILIPLEILNQRKFHGFNWCSPAAGTEIPTDVAQQLEVVWHEMSFNNSHKQSIFPPI